MDDGEAPYLLAPHVHLCVCGRHTVLMDLRRNKYLALEPAHLLEDWVMGWPVADPPAPRSGVDRGPRSGRAGTGAPRAPRLLQQLLEQGVLVRDGREGRPAAALVIPPAQHTLLEFDFDEQPAADATHLGRFALAWMRARSSLALRPMHSIVRAVEARKARRSPDSCAPDPRRERELVKTFVHLRPLFYTLQRACLLDSLTLVHFLAAYGLYPQWVFGVRTAPFDAHCWVQRDEVLLNDLPDRIRQYSPILLV